MADDNLEKTTVMGGGGDTTDDLDKTTVLDKTTIMDGDKTTVMDRTTIMDSDRTTVMERTTVLDGDKTTVMKDSSVDDDQYDDAGDRTMAYGSGDSMETTMRPDTGMSDSEMVGPVNNVFNLRGDEYEQVSVLSENTGEAQVFLVKKDGKEFVLKLYYPNFDINKKLLQVVRSFDFEMIVNLIDYGKTYVDGKNRQYELMEYLKGGTLKDVKLKGDFNRFRRLALQAAAALAYCHKSYVLHKDVKPTNYFFRDEEQKELVLGDFGISSLQDAPGKSFRTTQARTPIYAAPEMYTDVIDGVVEITYAADFYSLGMTLFALWLGESPMSTNERTMMKQKNEGRLPRLNELPDRVKQIVQGLTSVNQQTRWGYDEVERWFKGEDVAVDISSPFLRYKSFVVDPERNLIAENVHELVPLLLDNEQLGMNYLYNGRIISWLESSGNVKMSAIVKDIVQNRYPNDQRAGLYASCYAMEPTMNYRDVSNDECEDVMAIAMSLLTYQEKYAIMLTNPHDSLFLWLEARGIGDVKRLRKYFDGALDAKVAVLRMIYELDANIPFLAHLPSMSVEEIVHSFGHEQVRDDDWHALCDGRLLSWLYSHEDLTICEKVRLLTEKQPFSMSLAYKVLYSIEPFAAYDLKEATTPEKIGALLVHELIKCQRMSEEELAELMVEYTDPNGRFCFYARQYGWNDLVNEAGRCFDLMSEENHERLGAYDLHTALYRFCCILGCKPVYYLQNGTTLTDGRNLDSKKMPQIRTEMRNGSLTQWMSVFYHEDPSQFFDEDYSYEQELAEWVKALGELDPQQNYFRRYKKAMTETEDRINQVRVEWRSAHYREEICRMSFFVLSGLWALMVLVLGLDDRTYIFRHHVMCIILPLGGMTGVIIASRSYFRGIGAFFSLIIGGLGLLTSYIPYYVLNYVNNNYPGWFHAAVLGFTAIYVAVAKLTDFSRDQKLDKKFVNQALEEQDIKTTLLEPLYFAFKTKSQRYKATHFSVLDEIEDHINSLSGESVIHYILWSLLALVMILELCLFSPHVVGWKQAASAHKTESVK